MAGAIDLPEVVQQWEADVSQYVAAMAEMVAATEAAAKAVEGLQAVIDSLHGKTVDLGVDTAASKAAAAVNDLADAEWKANAAGRFQIETSKLLAETDDLLAGQEERLTASYEARAAAAKNVVAANKAEADNARALAAATAAVASEQDRAAVKADIESGALGFLVTSTGAAAKATDSFGAAAGRAWQPWFLFGNTWKTALHWIVAGGAELLAVTIPALVALGAGALVAVQGAQNVQRHMTALWTAFEAGGPAVGKTMGDFLGLGHALQTAQNQANPGVYELLGSAINDAKASAQHFATTGLQVVHMLDEFSARITVDLAGQGGAQLRGFLNGMVTDLQQLGQVLGNFGHALVNVFSDMPGLVHVLLAMVDGVSRLALVLSEAPAGLVTFAIAMEEVFRWGGLLVGVLARLAGAGALLNTFAAGGGFITRFAAGVKALVVQGGMGIAMLGNLMTRMGAITGAGEAAGAAIEGFGTDVALAGAEVSTAAVAIGTLGVAAFAGLVIALSRVKDATDRWVASTDQAVSQASDLQVLPKIGQVLAENQIRAAAATQKTTALLKDQGTQAGYLTARFGAMNGETQRAAQDSIDLTVQQQRLIGTARTVGQNVGFLASAFHVSAAGALALANAAGVNLQVPITRSSEAMKIAVQQIRNMEAGLGAMGAPAGIVGADMEALGIQSQLAGTKVQQVNSAFDQFIGTVTSGMGGLAQFEGALNTMGHDAVSSSVGINGAINSISRSATQMGFTLQGMGPKAQQSWQQFTAAVQQGNSALDFMRTGMAEGVVSANQFASAAKAVVGQLLPFAAHSATARSMISALAQEAGGPATTSMKALAQWAGVTGGKARDQLAKGIEAATRGMSNMTAVARNLSAVVSGQLDAAMAGAIVKASGIGAATLKYAQDLAKPHEPASVLKGDINAINTAMGRQATATAKVAQAVQGSAKTTAEMAADTGKAADAATRHAAAAQKQAAAAQKAGTAIQGAARAASGGVSPTNSLASRTSDLGNKANTMGGHMQTAGSHVAAAGAQAGSASGKMQQLGTSTQRVDSTSRTAASAVNNLHTAIGNASSAAAGATGRMAQLSVSEGRVGTSAFQAAAAVRQLASAIDSLHSKTISVTTVMSTVHHAAAGGIVGQGLQHGGIIPGFMPGRDTVPAMLSPGEAVLNPYAVRMLGSQFIHWANAVGDGGGGGINPAALRHGFSGGINPGGPMVVHAHLYVDGRELGTSVRQEGYRWQTRNAGLRSGLSIPGTRIG